jgi:hypothetical protein
MAEIDPQVMTAARDLSDEAKEHPEWLWFSLGALTTFGRWAQSPHQAPYIRADLCVLASTHTRALEALREAREALGQLAALASDIPDTWDDNHQCVTACGHFRRAKAALSRIAAILKDEP